MPSSTCIIFFPSRVIFHATQEALLLFYHLIIRLPLHIMSTFLDACKYEAGGIGTFDAGSARPSDTRPHRNITDLDDDNIDSTELTDVDQSKFRTNNPYTSAQVPASSRSRQMSLGLRSILPLRPPPESDSEDGDDTGSSQSRQLETHISPIRLHEALSLEETPSSNDKSSSAYSTPAELLFGPQSVPFVLRRRAIANSSDHSPSKGPFITENYRPVLMSTPNVVVQPSDDVGDQGSAAEIGRVSASRTEVLGERRKEVKLSVWRKEQIKYTKRARLEPNATPKHIPALHGPLSLPYSRNPR